MVCAPTHPQVERLQDTGRLSDEWGAQLHAPLLTSAPMIASCRWRVSLSRPRCWQSVVGAIRSSGAMPLAMVAMKAGKSLGASANGCSKRSDVKRRNMMSRGPLTTNDHVAHGHPTPACHRNARPSLRGFFPDSPTTARMTQRSSAESARQGANATPPPGVRCGQHEGVAPWRISGEAGSDCGGIIGSRERLSPRLGGRVAQVAGAKAPRCRRSRERATVCVNPCALGRRGRGKRKGEHLCKKRLRAACCFP